MTTYFVDSSALGRRYLPEIGSAWVLNWITKSAGNVIIVSDLAPIEMFSAFARLQRDGVFTAADVASFQNALIFDLQREYLTVPLDATVLIEARNLVAKYTLRALDGLQLACAKQAQSILNESINFVSGDNRLLAAATSERFVVDNPYLHP